MRSGGTESVTQLSRCRVGVSSWIDQHSSAVHRELKRKRIGMSVPTIVCAVMATIEEQIISLRIPTIAHHVVAALFEAYRLLSGFTRADFVYLT